MARGDQLNGESDRKTVALVGDSSIVNGLSMEGLNNAGTLQRQFLVVLNDNGMSIGTPQGALAGYFDKVRVSNRFSDFKTRAQEVLKKLPAGEYVEEIYNRLGKMTKAALNHTHLFEHFGLLCVGPIDGHDLPALIEMLEEVKQIDRPVLLHVKTIKGKGFEFSSEDPTTFHSPKPFVINGCRAELKTGGRSFTTAYADALTRRDGARPQGGHRHRRHARRHRRLAKVLPEYPDRALDVGIAEEHAMDMCAGMAKTGLKPFVDDLLDLHAARHRPDLPGGRAAGAAGPLLHGSRRPGRRRRRGAPRLHGRRGAARLPGMVLTAAIDEPTLRGGAGIHASVTTTAPPPCATRGTTCPSRCRRIRRPSNWDGPTCWPREATWPSWPTVSRPTTPWRPASNSPRPDGPLRSTTPASPSRSIWNWSAN